MKRTIKSSVSSLFPFLLWLAVSTAWANTEDTAGNKNTITRQFDHIVITGSDLAENRNKPIPLMRLYAFKGGKMRPIPFQVDEITEDTDWVLPQKSPYLSKKMADKARLIKDDPPEIMDDNDELAFMITDIGDRADPSVWPADWLSAEEITLTDPLTDDQGWVYLFSFAEPRELSPLDYVEYRLPENKNDRIYTDVFTLGFSHEVPITQNYIAFNDGDNILDRMKIRMYFRFFYVIKFDRNENDMKSHVWQYKDGPIRAVRMVRSSVRLVGSLQSPQILSETLYYRNAVLMPLRIKMLNLGKGIINEAFVDSGGDFRDRYGWKVRLSSDERWLTVDGKMDEVENSIKTEDARWFILKGPGKAQIIYIYYLGDYGLDTEFYYLDDDVNEHPPEFHPGQVPYIGFHIYGLENMKSFKLHQLNIICF